MTEEKTVLQLEAEYYEKKLYHSYSSLNLLLYSPKAYYKKYVLQQREEKLDQHLIEGKVIHCLLLDNGSFDKNFIVSPTKLPGDNARLIVDKIFQFAKGNPGELVDYSVEIVQTLVNINLHQSLKTDQQRIDKIITDETLSYWAYLKQKGNKDILDQETLTKCQESVTELRANERVSSLLKLNEKSNDVMNEFYTKIEGDPFGLKGTVDNTVIDHAAKVIYINDLKTTGKTISEFKETVEFYKYWLQAAVYMHLVRNMGNMPPYDIIFTFVVIDKYLQVYPFEVSKVTRDNWLLKFEEVKKAAEFHYKERRYSLPFEFEIQTVTL